jgi:hypothetical protein
LVDKERSEDEKDETEIAIDEVRNSAIVSATTSAEPLPLGRRAA